MKAFIIKFLTLLITLICAIGALIWWLGRPPSAVIASMPGMDNVPPGARNRIEKIAIGEFFKRFDNEYDKSLTGEWPRFRGKDFSNISRDGIKLLDRWPKKGPQVIWRKKLGEGHAAPVIYQGKVYVLDYLEDEQADALRCFSLRDGHELWRRWYKIKVKRNHGRSRTIPAVTADYVVTMGPKCQVMCVRTDSGELLWGKDLVREYGTEVPQWYTGQCPLIDGSTVVLAPGGKDALLIGVNAVDGKVLWQTPNPDGWNMSHASIMPMTLNGRRMYVYSSLGGVVGVSAELADRGKVLWKMSKWAPSVIAPSPVIMDNGLIFLTAGYGAGSMTIRVSYQNGKYKVEELNRYRPRQGLALEQQSAIWSAGILWGIMPKDAGARRMLFVGCDPNNVAEFKITGPRELRFGLGPFIKADGKFYILDDRGTLTMIKISGDKCNILGRSRVLNGHDAWGPIALADGYMLVRDSTSMACLNLRGEK
ncbi:MAG: PQQ-binding-like beta-propeller repeat protein [Victivallaceae bacterium]|nr:PQQ-binding-like beta-propeller repeat protein [Victivallaceae bacterium]